MFENILKELRIERRLTQKQLADQLGVKRYNVSDWENGRSEPDIARLISIARFFDVSVDYLVGNDELAFFNKK